MSKKEKILTKEQFCKEMENIVNRVDDMSIYMESMTEFFILFTVKTLKESNLSLIECVELLLEGSQSLQHDLITYFFKEFENNDRR